MEKNSNSDFRESQEVLEEALQILEGATGKVKRSVPMPKAPASKERPYDVVSGDSIAFFNLLGHKDRHEILVKDRYQNFWVFNNGLELLWQGQEQTGHYPYPVDIDGDGRDESRGRAG